ncbi:MAG: hypothetical protein AAF985_10030 [Bacteroidota bacterium]
MKNTRLMLTTLVLALLFSACNQDQQVLEPVTMDSKALLSVLLSKELATGKGSAIGDQLYINLQEEALSDEVVAAIQAGALDKIVPVEYSMEQMSHIINWNEVEASQSTNTASVRIPGCRYLGWTQDPSGIIWDWWLCPE